MARWVCRLHNLYCARRSAVFVRLALLYKVILVGINLSRQRFRMDLSFNQFSLTERLGLFSEKEFQQLLICCRIASQLAFLN